jgi:hypothetical protein
MGLPKRTKGFRDRAAEDKDALQNDYEESYNTKDDRGFALGSFFDLELVKDLGVEIWRPDIGDHIIDVIPFYAGKNHPVKEEGQLTYKVDFWGHQRIGPMNDFFVCKANTWKLPDPICTWMKQNYIEDKKQYNAIKPSRRCGYLVWVHDNDEQEQKGIQIFEVSHFFFEKKVAEISKQPRGGGFIDWTHYDTGRHVYWGIAKTGSYEDAGGTKRDSIEYSGFQLIPRETPKIPDHILEQSFALDELINMRPSDEEVSEAFFGTATPPPAKEQEETSRLPKKTALEKAREAAEQEAEGPADEDAPTSGETPKEEPDSEPEKEETKTPPPDDQRFGENDGLGPDEATQPPPAESSSTAHEGTSTPVSTPSSDLVCPAAEVGGQFGVTIEQLDECDDCDIWEKCSDESDRISKGGSAPAETREPAKDTPKKGG